MAQFMEWLKSHLDQETFPTCRWKDKDNQIFEVLWPKADKKSCGTPNNAKDRLGIMYAWWVHKFGNSRLEDQATSIKGNFRSCINSKITNRDMDRLSPTAPRIGGKDEWKVFRFLDRRTDKTPRKRIPEDNVTSKSDVDIWRHYPSHQWIDDIINQERKEVQLGHKTWKVKIEFLREADCFYETTYDYQQQGLNLLLFYFIEGNGQPMPKEAERKIKAAIPRDIIKKNLLYYPVVPRKEDRDFIVEGRSYLELMCPIMAVEFDDNLNIYIRRLCTSHLYHTNTKSMVYSRWEKIKRTTNHHEFNDHETYRKNVFNYSLFLTRDHVMNRLFNNKYDLSTLEIDAIPETFSLTTEEPSPQYGLSGCRTQIRFTHEPAKSNKTYTPPEKTIPISSEDPHCSNKKQAVNRPDYSPYINPFIPPTSGPGPHVTPQRPLYLPQVPFVSNDEGHQVPFIETYSGYPPNDTNRVEEEIRDMNLNELSRDLFSDEPNYTQL